MMKNESTVEKLPLSGRTVLAAGRDAVFRLLFREDGVALVTTLACFMFMYLICMGVYAIGTAVREKIQLQNAADAAAYSAAVVQADTMSRIAAINRAMAWTYVQMTRRQMDFIVDKWLERSLKIYREDEKNARDWNKMSILLCNQGHNGAGPRSDTYWCGINENNIGLIWVNGLPTDFDEVPVVGKATAAARQIPGLDEIGLGRALSVSDIEKRRGKFKEYTRLSLPFSGDYITMLTGDTGQQILFDKANIAAMNFAELHLVYELKSRIEKTVYDILCANIPDGDIEADRVFYHIDQAESHFACFRFLNNTKQDEQIFYSFAGYKGEPFEVFRGDPLTWQGLLVDSESLAKNAVWSSIGKTLGVNVMNGTDRWFVRGNGTRRAKDGDFGIQRSYKHWAEDVLADKLNLHNSKYIKVKVGNKALFLPPSNFNFNGDDNKPSSILKYPTLMADVLSNEGFGLPSVGLYSQWQWYSMMWFCTPVIIPFPPWIYWIHRSLCPSLFFCKHNEWGLKIDGENKNCIYLPGDVIPCWYKKYRKKRWRIKKSWHSSASGKFTDFGIPGFRGYTRVYGDDPVLWNAYKEQYVGEKCMPLLVSPLYFGELGTITVGVARKNENAWSRLIGTAIEMAGNVFRAYEPAVEWSWAFSSAKAGYKDPETSYEDSNAYIVDWRGADNGKWNLCQSDWDAVFVPVSKAKSLAAHGLWVDAESELSRSVSEYLPMRSDFLEKWMYASGSDWKPLRENGEKLDDGIWRDVKSPPGMLRSQTGAANNDSTLDWKSLPSKFRH